MGSYQTSSSARVALYDNMKFVLMALVLSGHFWTCVGDHDPTIQAIWRWMYLFHMPAFLFVGGIFSKKLYTKEHGLRVNTIAFYLVLGICLYTLLWAYQHLYGKSPSFNLFSISNIPWYFFTTASLGASLPIIAKIRGGAKTVLPISIAIAVIAGFSPDINDFLCLGRTLPYAPFYYAGYFLSTEGFASWAKKTRERKWTVFIAIVFMIATILAYRFLPKPFTDTVAWIQTGHNPYNAEGYPMIVDACIRLGTIVMASIMILALAIVVPNRKCAITPLGSRTLQVYFFHPFIYYPIKGLEVLHPLAIYEPLTGFIVFLCSWILTALLAWPKWPNEIFRRIRKGIRIDNDV